MAQSRQSTQEDVSAPRNDFPEKMNYHGFSSYDFRNTELDGDDSYQLGRALGSFYGPGSEVVVGRDHRNKSPELRDGLIQGLREKDIETEYIGLAPTDMISFWSNYQEADGGIAVTASHMPPEYRGLKPLNHDGRILNSDELEEVLEEYAVIETTESNYFQAPEHGENDVFEPALDAYVDAVRSRYFELFDSSLEGFEVVVDPGNGVGSITLPAALEELGVNDEDLYIVNEELDPEFSGRGADPTDAELEQLEDSVIAEGADLGIALDGDADRAVLMNERGERVTGDEALAILGEKYVDASNEEETVEVTGSVNTSQMVEEYMIENSAGFKKTPVGAVFTAEEQLKLRSESPEVVFGGQPNGHYLDAAFTPYDSGTVSGIMAAGIVAESGESFSEHQSKLPSFLTRRENIEVENTVLENKDQVMGFLQDQFETLDGERISESLLDLKSRPGNSVQEASEEVWEADIHNMRVLMRQSGTEDVVRLMMETRDPESVVEELAGTVRR